MDQVVWEDPVCASTWTVASGQLLDRILVIYCRRALVDAKRVVQVAQCTLCEHPAYFNHKDLWFELQQRGHQGGLLWFQELTQDKPVFNNVVRVLM